MTKVEKLEAELKRLEEKRKAVIEEKRKAEKIAQAKNRKAEESVKYALGGLVLKLHKENQGGLVLREEDNKLYLMSIDKIVEMLQEPQRETAREMLKC